jgi:hypothetical protein
MKNLDKFYHFIAGMFVTLIIGALSFASVGLFGGIAAAIGKELYDYAHPEQHTVDAIDFISTVVGVIVAYIILAGGFT